MKRLFLAIAFLCCAQAHAACTGSGLSWSCPAGATYSDVNTMIGSATDGAVATFAAGAYTWSGNVALSMSKGITLICASTPLSVGASTTAPCTVTLSAQVGTTALTGTNNHFYRISGFTFSEPNSAGLFLLYFDTVSNGSGTMSQLRIDHNTFQLTAGDTAIFFGDTSSTGGYYYGVTDHNSFTSPVTVNWIEWIGNGPVSPPTSTLGTSQNMFIEDNAFATITENVNNGSCLDGWGGASFVFRYNKVTDCIISLHGVTHAGGPENLEAYGNAFIQDSGSNVQDCYRCIHHQGSGTMMFFNNALTPYSGHNADAISILNYRDAAWSGSVGSGTYSIDGGVQACDGTIASQSFAGITFSDGNRSLTSTWYGYPCWHQPGRDFGGNYKPIYGWNNYWTDTLAEVSIHEDAPGGTPPPSCTAQPGGTCDYTSIHMLANRDWYNAVSASAQSNATTPFNGTTGAGFGTFANRPATCTTNSTESGAGVGYYATDVGSLYTCSATNTWTVYYTPYTYPHPLTNTTVAPSGTFFSWMQERIK